MKNFPLPIFLLCAALALMAESCYYDNEAELHPGQYLDQACDTTLAISFSAHIQPILDSSCGTGNSCHGTANTSGIPLNTHAGVKAKVDDGRLYSAVIWDGTASNMPKGSSVQLNGCYLAQIRLWIESGAPNN